MRSRVLQGENDLRWISLSQYRKSGGGSLEGSDVALGTAASGSRGVLDGKYL